MMSGIRTTYHEVDFLLPAQRFNINFSYISKKGLPFYREFLLRVIHLAPMSKSQVSIYFGLSRRETDEAVSDLVERGELTLSSDGRLTLTERSKGYFSDLGESLKIASVQDSGAVLSFDLATFSCLGNILVNEKWKAGISLSVDNSHVAQSESLAEKHFQRQFHEIFEKGYLSDSLGQDGKDTPTVYTVNSVNKLRQLPLRLTTYFNLDGEGQPVERDDFEQLSNSELVHELMTSELSRLARSSNVIDVVKVMMQIGDEDTLKLFGSSVESIQVSHLEDLSKLEENANSARKTFLGPIYSKENWTLFQRYLAPVLTARVKSNSEFGSSQFIWVAPSDPFWAKSQRFTASLSDFLDKASTKGKKDQPSKQLYKPTIFVPLADQEDTRTARHWTNQLEPFHNNVKGLVEGFFDGNVEVLYFENELVVVIYHLSLPNALPISLPVGFISKEISVVQKIGALLQDYVSGSAAFDKPNDCGLISNITSPARGK